MRSASGPRVFTAGDEPLAQLNPNPSTVGGFFFESGQRRARGPNVDGARGRYALSRPTVPGRRFGVAFLRGQRLNATLHACVWAFGTLRSGVGGSAPGGRSPRVDNSRCIGQLSRFRCPGGVLWWHAPPHFCGRSCRATVVPCRYRPVTPPPDAPPRIGYRFLITSRPDPAPFWLTRGWGHALGTPDDRPTKL